MSATRSMKLLCGLGLGLAASVANAGLVTTFFGPGQWGASDATLGITGYTIENFEDTSLAAGLQVSRLNGAVGNFGPTSTLPANSVFNPLTDNDTDAATPANSVQAFRRGIWDGSHVLINNPGPAFYHWYGDAQNWKDFQLDFADGVTSVGFSLQQMDLHGNRLLVNGVPLYADLLGAFGAELEDQAASEGPFRFNSRTGYLRIDATNGELIHSLLFDNDGGDGFAIDHLAFKPVATPVPVPAAVWLMASGVMALRLRRGGSVEARPEG